MDSYKAINEYLNTINLKIGYLRGNFANKLCCICQAPYITPIYEKMVISMLVNDIDNEFFSTAIFDTNDLRMPIANCIYHLDEDNRATIHLLCKAESCKIPRIGAMLLYFVCYALRDYGTDIIELNTTDNKQAIKLYEGIGFVRQEEPNSDTMLLDTSKINPFIMKGGRSKAMKF